MIKRKHKSTVFAYVLYARDWEEANGENISGWNAAVW